MTPHLDPARMTVAQIAQIEKRTGIPVTRWQARFADRQIEFLVVMASVMTGRPEADIRAMPVVDLAAMFTERAN